MTHDGFFSDFDFLLAVTPHISRQIEVLQKELKWKIHDENLSVFLNTFGMPSSAKVGFEAITHFHALASCFAMCILYEVLRVLWKERKRGVGAKNCASSCYIIFKYIRMHMAKVRNLKCLVFLPLFSQEDTHDTICSLNKLRIFVTEAYYAFYCTTID